MTPEDVARILAGTDLEYVDGKYRKTIPWRVLVAASGAPASLDAPIRGEDPEEDRVLGSVVLREETTLEEDVARRDLVERLLETLGERERDLLYRRFWLDERLEDCGAAWGITRERARQLIARSIARMRAALGLSEDEER